MNRPRIAALAAAVALGCAATASAAVLYYPEGYVTYEPRTVRIERVTAPEVVTYDDRYVYYTTNESPRVVERYVAPGETVVVQSDPIVVNATPYYSANNMYDSRHPQWGHLLDHGLFNRRGPNDFGR